LIYLKGSPGLTSAALKRGGARGRRNRTQAELIMLQLLSPLPWILPRPRVGSAAEAAIYTEHLHELSLPRKIRLRMRSWQNYVFFESL
jgi:hypothetical protein